jgi:bifunctional enzyme CysN/CysC
VRDTLRFITCGSVDDGKSTLIGRLLWETKQVFEDQLSAAEKDSTRYGTVGSQVDLALLMDGLQAEREQGITIDVAYRFFATPSRRFVVADTPGHEQYTRNMATGASTSDAAVLVVDARKGLQVQTHRHARIVALLGIRHLIMAVNKMDLVGWDEKVFRQIELDMQPLLHELGITSFQAIPVSALAGDNVTQGSSNAPWYSGPTLLGYLEQIDASEGAVGQPAGSYVPRILRPHCRRAGEQRRSGADSSRRNRNAGALHRGLEGRGRHCLAGIFDYALP